jgi:hypothetical protein
MPPITPPIIAPVRFPEGFTAFGVPDGVLCGPEVLFDELEAPFEFNFANTVSNPGVQPPTGVECAAFHSCITDGAVYEVADLLKESVHMRGFKSGTSIKGAQLCAGIPSSQEFQPPTRIRLLPITWHLAPE